MPHTPPRSLMVVVCIGRKLHPTLTQISPFRSLTSGLSSSIHCIPHRFTVHPQLGFSASDRGLGSSTTSCRPPYHSYSSPPLVRLGCTITRNCSKSFPSDQKGFLLHSYSCRCREPHICPGVVFGKYIRCRLCSISHRQLSNRAVTGITHRVSLIHKWGL